MSKCSVPYCSNTLSAEAILTTCPTCRSWMHRILNKKRSEQISYLERHTRLNSRANLIFRMPKDVADTSTIEHERLQADGIMMFGDVDKDRVAAIQKRDAMRAKGAQVIVSIKDRQRRRA